MEDKPLTPITIISAFLLMLIISGIYWYLMGDYVPLGEIK